MGSTARAELSSNFSSATSSGEPRARHPSTPRRNSNWGCDSVRKSVCVAGETIRIPFSCAAKAGMVGLRQQAPRWAHVAHDDKLGS
jgi:hypothetical protein